MAVIGAIAVPHPPLIIPEVGRGKQRGIQKTIRAYATLAKQVSMWIPELLVVISPHSDMQGSYFHVANGDGAVGNMAQYDAADVTLSVRYDRDLRDEIIYQAEKQRLPISLYGESEPGIDHGTFIPMYFLQNAGVDCPIVRLAPSHLSASEHYELGRCIARAAESVGKRVLVVASGDMSHKLSEDGPYGYAPEGPALDSRLTAALGDGDFLTLLTQEEEVCERAAICGLGAFQIMAGALDGHAVQSELLSYEGPYGVGYAVASFRVTEEDAARFYEGHGEKDIQSSRENEDPWTRFAQMCVESVVKTGALPKQLPHDLPSEMMDEQAGVFVTLKKHGELRGCIGTIVPTTSCVAVEIARNARSVCTNDTRFVPVDESELDSLTYEVSVLSPLEEIQSVAQLDVKRYGVIVSTDTKMGVLLPDIADVDTPEQQIDIARSKGGIEKDEPYTLHRFEVTLHT